LNLPLDAKLKSSLLHKELFLNISNILHK